MKQVDQSAAAVLKAVLKNPNEPVDIFGWSKGSVAALILAGRLNQMGIKVRFIGLIDPVAQSANWDTIEILLGQQIPNKDRRKGTSKEFWVKYPAPVAKCVQGGVVFWTPPKESKEYKNDIDLILDKSVFIPITIQKNKVILQISAPNVGHKDSGFNLRIGYDLFKKAIDNGVPLTMPPEYSPPPIKGRDFWYPSSLYGQ